jgi:hypothetical protein
VSVLKFNVREVSTPRLILNFANPMVLAANVEAGSTAEQLHQAWREIEAELEYRLPTGPNR